MQVGDVFALRVKCIGGDNDTGQVRAGQGVE